MKNNPLKNSQPVDPMLARIENTLGTQELERIIGLDNPVAACYAQISKRVPGDSRREAYLELATYLSQYIK